MAFQKRINCVASGHQIPAIPTVPSSAKGKRSARKKVEVNQLSAIDLLANLAGKLLAEGEGFWTPSKEQVHNESPFKGGALDQASCDESRFAPLCVSHGRLSGTKQYLKSMEGRLSECQASENGGFGKKLFACVSMDEFTTKSIESTSPMESCVCKVDNETLIPSHGKQKTSKSLICHDSKNMFNIKGPIDPDRTPPAPVSSDSSVELPSYGNYSRAWNDGRELHVDKDVGENSSVSTPPNSIHLKAFKPHCLEIHRKRKFSNSNYIKADPARFNDGEVSNDDFKIKPVLRNRKLFYAHQGTHRESSKRRKLFDHCSDSPSYGISHDEALQDSLEKDGFRLEQSSLLEDLNGAKDNIGTKICSNSIYSSEDLPVKLSIKSFKVPELFIEIPANATVGSLKRTVMEAVMAVLGGGLRVGVLFQGKKVRDDSKTLQQAGISYAHKTDGLGFTLEPRPSGTPPPRNNHKESTFIISEPDPNNKFQASSDATFQLPQITIPTTDCIENGHENPAPENMNYFSKALVPVTALNSIIPLCKLRRSATAQQRRIRRPFSVSEVEALVQAVEKIGTGRWRDVKLQAFDNAKHRTYVDLKDKWKTLVHTAKISPQQRRGEPVPQDLLDRVLSTHAYWSHQQAKLPDPPEQRLLLNHA